MPPRSSTGARSRAAASSRPVGSNYGNWPRNNGADGASELAIGSAAVLVIAAAVTTYLVWPEPEVKIELTSPVVAHESPPLTIARSITHYDVTYDIQVIADTGEVERHLEKLSVRRPFDDHVIFYAGDTVTDTSEYDVIDNLGISSTSSGGDAPEVQQGLPTAGKTDVRLDVTLTTWSRTSTSSPANNAGSPVATAPCSVPAAPSRATPSPKRPTPTMSTSASTSQGSCSKRCRSTTGKVSLRVIATDIAIEPADDDSIHHRRALRSEQPTVRRCSKRSTGHDPQREPLASGDSADGYEHKARYVLKEAPSADAAATGVAPTSDTYVDVYVNGTMAFVIHQGAAQHEPQIDTTEAEPIDIGLLGEAKLVLGVGGNTVVANPTGMWFVHINATLPTADHQTLAGQLR